MDGSANIRLDKDLKKKAKAYAKRKGLNISALIRVLLIKEMEVKNEK